MPLSFFLTEEKGTHLIPTFSSWINSKETPWYFRWWDNISSLLQGLIQIQFLQLWSFIILLYLINTSDFIRFSQLTKSSGSFNGIIKLISFYMYFSIYFSNHKSKFRSGVLLIKMLMRPWQPIISFNILS